MRSGFWLHVGYVSEGKFVSAHQALTVPWSGKFLTITVAMDKTTYQPRETVRYRISARDAEGKPAQAELSLAVVDEAIFSLMPDRTPNIRSFFFGLPDNYVETDWRWVETAPLRYAQAGKLPLTLSKLCCCSSPTTRK